MIDNPLKEFTLEVNGIIRKLRFDLNAFSFLQDWLEKDSFAEIFEVGLFTPKYLPTLIAAGLKHGWDDVTPELIAHADMPINKAIEAVTKAFNHALVGKESKPDTPLSEKNHGKRGNGGNV